MREPAPGAAFSGSASALGLVAGARRRCPNPAGRIARPGRPCSVGSIDRRLSVAREATSRPGLQRPEPVVPIDSPSGTDHVRHRRLQPLSAVPRRSDARGAGAARRDRRARRRRRRVRATGPRATSPDGLEAADAGAAPCSSGSRFRPTRPSSSSTCATTRRAIRRSRLTTTRSATGRSSASTTGSSSTTTSSSRSTSASAPSRG